MFYVYSYLRNKDSVTAKAGTPYYIGKGHGNRAYDFRRSVPKPKDKAYIIILENNLTEIGALALERRLISWWGRKDIKTGILLNRTDGGEGHTGPHPKARGLKRPEWVKKKMSALRKLKPLTPAQRVVLEKMAEINKGGTSWNSGIQTGTRTDIQITNMQLAQQVKWAERKEKRDNEYFKNPSLCSQCLQPLSFRKRKYKFCDKICTGLSKRLC